MTKGPKLTSAGWAPLTWKVRWIRELWEAGYFFESNLAGRNAMCCGCSVSLVLEKVGNIQSMLLGNQLQSKKMSIHALTKASLLCIIVVSLDGRHQCFYFSIFVDRIVHHCFGKCNWFWKSNNIWWLLWNPGKKAIPMEHDLIISVLPCLYTLRDPDS